MANDSRFKNLPSYGYAEMMPLSVPEDAIPVYFQKPRSKKYDARWLLLWQDDDELSGVSMYEQAKSGELTLRDYRVRDIIFCKCDIENYVHINQSEIARILNIGQSHVSESIKHLVELGIILEGPKAGKFRTYRINPAVAFNGSLADGIERRNDIIRQRKLGATVFKFPEKKNCRR